MRGFKPTSKSRPTRWNWQRRWRYYYNRFLRMRGTPESIARGFAAGVFTGMFPAFGLQIVTGVALATLLRGNKIVAAAATWISNPITDLPIWALNFQVGRWVLGSGRAFNPQSITSFENLLKFGTEFAIELLVGSLLMASVCAVGSYFLTLRAVRRGRRYRRSLQKSSKI
ncbi:MAG: DUF2062 domain-containing protein [Oscillatoriaceae cyanobacterium Prado104]|nr:DUF2062 domain-containing protein [Oscillatoriaceae cyanobacterium Prado104]